MKTESLRPREWLLSRHQAAHAQLDALRRAALPTPPAEPEFRRGLSLLVPALTGLAAALVFGTIVFQDSRRRDLTRNAASSQPVVEAPVSPVREEGFIVDSSRPPVTLPTRPSATTWAQPVRNPIVVVRKTDSVELIARSLPSSDPAQPLLTEVFPFNRIKAQDAAAVFESIIDASGGGKVQVNASSNSLLVTERANRLGRLRPLLGVLDREAESMPPARYAANVPAPSPGVPAPVFPHLSRRHITANDVMPNSGAVRVDPTVAPVPARAAGINPYTPKPPPQTEPPANPLPANAVWKPVLNWTNAGNATPAAAIESWLWAHLKRQPQALLATISWSDAAQQKISAFYDALPAGQRAQYPNAAAMFASLSVEMPSAANATGMVITRQTTTAAGDVVVSVDCQLTDGRVRSDTRTFHRFADGWKIVLSDNVVDGVLNYHRRRQTEQR